MNNVNLEISIVVPVFNERDNIAPLFQELTGTLTAYGKSYEILFVDDGSNDGSSEILKRLAQENKETKAIILRKNFGQTAAMAAGFQSARGRVIIPLDGDGQNDPKDIPLMVEKLYSGGYDVVSGWRKNRKDGFLRVFLSKIANILISRVSGIGLHDSGCTLKAYRREILKDIQLYGEMHRLIPIFIGWIGGKVGEKEVHHRPRTHGSSKYGFARIFKVLIDLITAKFMSTYLEKPAYVFGSTGIIMLIFSLLGFGFVIIRKLFFKGVWLSPLIFISLGGLGLSIIIILMGILSEIIVRFYFESQRKLPYIVKEIVGDE